MQKKAFFVGILFLSAFSCADGKVAENKVLSSRPVIDGEVKEDEWSGSGVLEEFVDPVTGKAPADAMKVLYGTMKEGLYVAFVMHDDPNNVIAQTKQEGVEFDGEDMAIIVIDPQNRRSWTGASTFRVNPFGIRQEQIAGGRAAKREWKGDWEGAAKKTEFGWTAELFVPWAILNSPSDSTGDVLINFARWQQKKNIESQWSNLTERELPELNGTLTGVQFPPAPKPEVEMLGYVSPEYDEAEDPKTTLRGGIDFRYRPTLSTTGVLSINPDFKNIEGEIAGIEFTRSERRLSDTRPFFTEGANYFNLTGNYTIGNMFYSRRIDDFDQGIKFFGDLNTRNQIGVLATREDGNKHDAVVKYNYLVDERSNVSFYSTLRDRPGMQSSVIGSSGEFGKGNFGFEYDLVQATNNGQPRTAGSVAFSYAQPRFFTIARAYYVQPDFENPLGFIRFTDLRGGYVFSEYNVQVREGSIRNFGADLFIENFQRFDNSNFSKSVEFSGYVTLRNDFRFGVSTFTNRFEDEESQSVGAFVAFNVSDRYKNARVSFETGERAGMHTSFVNLRGNYRLGGIDFGLSHSIFTFDGQTDQTILTAGWEMDRTRSLTARWVSSDGESNWYLAYRNAGGKGLEWYLIVGDPNADSYRDRIALKLVWAK